MKLPLLASALCSALAIAPAVAAPSFINGLAIDGGLIDNSGFPSVKDSRVGFLSDLYYDPNRGQW
jgi:hypothetical protein